MATPSNILRAVLSSAIILTGCQSVPHMQATSDPIEILDGISNPEDMAILAQTPYLLVSSYDKQSGALYAVDRSTTRIYPGFPAANTTFNAAGSDYACPGKPNEFLPLGLHVEALSGNAKRIFVANTGEPNRIEVIDLEPGSATGPKYIWRDCLETPAGFTINGLVRLSDGSFVVTSTLDQKGDALARLIRGAPVGQIAIWKPGMGWRVPETPGISGPNGIIAARRANEVVISGFGDRTLYLYDIVQEAVVDTLILEFRPDNLRQRDDRSIIVAGFDLPNDAPDDCLFNPQCNLPSFIATVEVAEGKFAPASASSRAISFDGATVATEDNGRTWLGSFRGNAIAVLTPQTPEQAGTTRD